MESPGNIDSRTSEEPTPPEAGSAERRFNAAAIVDWLVDIDGTFAAEYARLNQAEPDMFASQEDQMAHLVQLAEVKGKMDLLNDFFIQFGGPEPTQ